MGGPHLLDHMEYTCKPLDLNYLKIREREGREGEREGERERGGIKRKNNSSVISKEVMVPIYYAL